MIKGFITNLGKYNEGELIGEWIQFPIDEDELEDVLKRIGISNLPDQNGNYYEEYFFTDWDCRCDLGEFENIERVNELAELLEYWEGNEIIFENACEIWNFEEVVENEPGDYYFIEDVYDEYDLGYYYVHNSGIYDEDLRKAGIFANHIDYESFGRDINISSSGGFTRDGWIERL